MVGSRRTRKLEEGSLDVGNREFGGHEAVIVLDNVCIPWERVFMAGKYAFSGLLVERFAGYHRQSYGGCKTGVGDMLIGAAQSLAQYQGADQASHIKDKIVEMIHLNETMYACGIACSAEGKPTASGTYLIDPLLANVCKLNVTRFLRDRAAGARYCGRLARHAAIGERPDSSRSGAFPG